MINQDQKRNKGNAVETTNIPIVCDNQNVVS